MLVIGGEVVPAEDHPYIVRIAVSAPTSTATATVIGSHTILTAAHNLRVNRNWSFQGHPMHCDMHPNYLTTAAPQRYHWDYAICRSEAPLGLAKAEVSFASPDRLEEKTEVFGYGCSRLGGGVDGQLRRAELQVVGIAGNDLVMSGKAAICPGDSGGPVMQSGELVAVISRARPTHNTNYAVLTARVSGWIEELRH